VRLWLEGNDLQIDWVRESLVQEYERLRSRALRRATTTADREAADKLTQKRLEKIAGQLGANREKASILAVRYPERELFNAYKAMRFGEEIFDIEKLSAHMLKELGLDQYIFLVETLDRNFINGVLGILGDPDEIELASIEVVKTASNSVLLDARFIVETLLFLAEHAVSFLSGDNKDRNSIARIIQEWVFNVKGFWRLPLIVCTLQWLSHNSDHGGQLLESLKLIRDAVKTRNNPSSLQSFNVELLKVWCRDEADAESVAELAPGRVC
jgi:hypothetical protein